MPLAGKDVEELSVWHSLIDEFRQNCFVQSEIKKGTHVSGCSSPETEQSFALPTLRPSFEA